jgi:polysaccharide pyruvyl transferase WcaK-like protein
VKIVIAGTSVYGIENMGDEALLAVLCRELHNDMPDLEITWLARHPSKKLDELYGIQKSIKNLDHDSKEQSIGRWFWGLNPSDPPDNLRGIIKALEESDLLIVGGDPFNEISMGVYRGLAPQASLLITLAKFLEKTVMLYSIHMGRPLKTDLGRELTKYCVANSAVVTLREAFSKKVLENMEISTKNTVVLADPAWGLDPFEDAEKGKSILEKEGIQFKSDKVVGVNFRHQYWTWSESDWEHYRSILVEICDYIVETMGADLLFIPNCTYDIDAKYTKYQDDRPAAKEIVERMKYKEHAHQIVNKYNLFETLSLFPLLDMHFSNRRHSLIFAAVHGIPPVACGGEWHVKPAMDELSIGDKFVNIEEFSAGLLKKSIDETWNNRELIKKRIYEVVPGLREKALQHAKVAAEVILK